tara:strand:- start:1326 stop:1547 length:222 start_codon:yes stop_codon:yes gene_type:complete
LQVRDSSEGRVQERYLLNFHLIDPVVTGNVHSITDIVGVLYKKNIRDPRNSCAVTENTKDRDRRVVDAVLKIV